MLNPVAHALESALYMGHHEAWEHTTARPPRCTVQLHCPCAPGVCSDGTPTVVRVLNGREAPLYH